MEDIKMPLVKVKKNFQVNIPLDIRKKINLMEGDYLEMGVSHGQLVVKPVVVHPKDETYFHSEEWQKGEAMADQDIKSGGLLGPFQDLKKGLKALKTAKI
jgi:AbrB family looped-hinge helix DNA binding protein